MNDFSTIHSQIPKKWVFISFLPVLLLDFIPLPLTTFFWLPEFTAMLLLYWALNRPQLISIGMAFWCGLLMDVGTVELLGTHSLSYMLMVFIIQKNRHQITLHSYDWQAIAILFALAGSYAVLLLVRLLHHHQVGEWLGFIAPVIGALLWPLFNKIMLSFIHLYRKHR